MGWEQHCYQMLRLWGETIMRIAKFSVPSDAWSHQSSWSLRKCSFGPYWWRGPHVDRRDGLSPSCSQLWGWVEATSIRPQMSFKTHRVYGTLWCLSVHQSTGFLSAFCSTSQSNLQVQGKNCGHMLWSISVCCQSKSVGSGRAGAQWFISAAMRRHQPTQQQGQAPLWFKTSKSFLWISDKIIPFKIGVVRTTLVLSLSIHLLCVSWCSTHLKSVGLEKFLSSTFSVSAMKLQKGQSLRKGRVTVPATSSPWKGMGCSDLGCFLTTWVYVVKNHPSFLSCAWAFEFSVPAEVYTSESKNAKYPPFWKAQPCNPWSFTGTHMLALCIPFSSVNMPLNACKVGEKRMNFAWGHGCPEQFIWTSAGTCGCSHREECILTQQNGVEVPLLAKMPQRILL